jgi:acyl-coenzyme A synthetase/AMP-(fatty) acid ligase
MLISPKNSSDAVLHLLKVSNSSYILVDVDNERYIRSLNTGLPTVVFQPLSNTQTCGKVASPCGGLEDRSKDLNLPAFYLHTSGSTGHPKTIPITHKVFSQWAQSSLQSFEECREQAFWVIGPLYHVSSCDWLFTQLTFY